MRNKSRIKYTLKHRDAFRLICDKYCPLEYKEELDKRKDLHDVDKVLMLLMDIKDVTNIHRINNAHHPESNKDFTNYDYVEMILDWESARYTKSDKPLNAYQTLYKYYPNLEENIKPLLIQMNLYNDDTTMDKEILDKLDYEINEDYIVKEAIKYIERISKYEE